MPLGSVLTVLGYVTDVPGRALLRLLTHYPRIEPIVNTLARFLCAAALHASAYSAFAEGEIDLLVTADYVITMDGAGPVLQDAGVAIADEHPT